MDAELATFYGIAICCIVIYVLFLRPEEKKPPNYNKSIADIRASQEEKRHRKRISFREQQQELASNVVPIDLHHLKEEGCEPCTTVRISEDWSKCTQCGFDKFPNNPKATRSVWKASDNADGWERIL